MVTARLAKGGSGSAHLARGGSGESRLASGGFSIAILEHQDDGFTPLSIPPADRLFFADGTTLQPASGSSPYAATGWGNLLSGGVGDLTVGSGHPNIFDPSAVHFLGGRRVQLVQADLDHFVCPGDAATYAAFSNGAGGTGILGFLPTSTDTAQFLFGTDNTTVNQTGFWLRYDGTSERLAFGWNDSSGTALLTVTTDNDSCLLGEPHVVSLQIADRTPGFVEDDVYDVEIRLDNKLIEGLELGASKVPPAGNPQGPMHIGRRVVTAAGYLGADLFLVGAALGLYGKPLSQWAETQRIAA